MIDINEDFFFWKTILLSVPQFFTNFSKISGKLFSKIFTLDEYQMLIKHSTDIKHSGSLQSLLNFWNASQICLQSS